MSKSYERGNRSATFKRQHEEFGATFQSMALGKTRIFTIDPDNARAIFSTSFEDWGVQPLRLAPWKPLLGAGVMDTDGPHWKYSRGMVQALFRREQIADLSSFDVHVDRLISLIPKDGSTVDMQPLFARLILDFTTEFLFGSCAETLTATSDPEAIAFLKAFHYGQGGIGRRTQLPYLTVFTRDPQFWSSCQIVRAFVDKYIDTAIARSQAFKSAGPSAQKYVLADKLVQATDDRELIRSQLLNTFLAAHDTTAVLLTNVFFNLARNPKEYAKLRKELLTLERVPMAADPLKRLPILNNVVQETSRLTPVVGQSARIALRDTILPTGGGSSGEDPVFVTKGTSVQFNYFALHRRPEVFGEDAETFRPDRWDGLEVGTWDFLPFIGGPRVCPAREMALMQVRYAVARIVKAYGRVENRDPVMEFVERYKITSDSKNGCKIALEPGA